MLFLCYVRHLENSCAFAGVLTQQKPLHPPFFKVSKAASPCLTVAAEGFEFAPACLIPPLVQEPQTGSSNGIACILQTCLGTLTLPWIHRWGRWKRDAPAKRQVHWISFAIWKWNGSKQCLVWSCGWMMPSRLCCQLPGSSYHLQLQRWGKNQLPRPTATRCPVSPQALGKYSHPESCSQPARQQVLLLLRPCWLLQASAKLLVLLYLYGTCTKVSKSMTLV